MSDSAFDAEQRMADWANKVGKLSVEELSSDIQSYYTEYHTRWKPIIRQNPQMVGFTERQFRLFETIKALMNKAETADVAIKSFIDESASKYPNGEFRDGYRGGLRQGFFFGGIAVIIGWYVARHFL
jgi:hypothetical protein